MPTCTMNLFSSLGKQIGKFKHISITAHCQGKPLLQYGQAADKPILPVPGEIFALRKLLPATSDYDFNIHIMDFHPGEYLNVKVSLDKPLSYCLAWTRLTDNQVLSMACSLMAQQH